MRTHRPLRGQGQLLTFIPYQLRFRPVHSVVLCGFDQRGILMVVARFDPLEPSDVGEADTLFGSGRLAELASATLVVFGALDELWTTAAILRDSLGRNGTLIDHICVVEGTQWHALSCSCGECPGRWTPLPEPAQVPPALAAIVDGVDAGLERVQLEQLATATVAETALAERVERLLVAGPQPAEVESLNQLLLGADPWSEQMVAGAVAAIAHLPLRDALLHRLRPADFDFAAISCSDSFVEGLAPASSFESMPRAARVRQLVRWACCVPPQESAGVWALVAAIEWAAGGGALATIAIDKALAADPAHALTLLIRRCLHHGVMPRDLTEVRTA